MTAGVHFFHTLVLSATLQLGTVVLILGILTAWRTARSEFFWPAVGLLSVATVITTHTFYRFAFAAHDLCWLNCLGSAAALAITAVSLALLIGRRVDVKLPGARDLGFAASAIGIGVIAIGMRLGSIQAVAKPTTETAFLLSAVLACMTAVFTIWLDRTVAVRNILHWSIRGVSVTAVVVTIGALSQLASVQLITVVVVAATMSIGMGIYAFHQESLVIDARPVRA